MVGLTATPGEGWELADWEGEVVQTIKGEMTVLVDKNKTARAKFEPLPGAQTGHTAVGVGFNMRLAPAATFPTGTDDSGEATLGYRFWIAETQGKPRRRSGMSQ